VRLNNAIAASVTAMAISYTSAEPGTPSLADWVKAWDDSTTPTDRGTVIISQISDATKQAIFRISGDLTDNTTWAEVPLVYQSGPGGFTAGAALSVQWSRTGNKGSDGVGAGDVVGPASAVSGRMVEFDGATGKLIRDGGVVVSSFAKTILDDTTAAAVRATIAAAPDFPWMPQGRLTLSPATPVMTGTVSGATTVYYTPFRGRAVPLWNGSTFVMTDTGGELSQATTDTTKSPAAVTTNSSYDYFAWSDSGTIRCTRGPAWSSDTARGTGAGTTELEMVNGFLVNKVAITNGPDARYGLYVGTVRSNGSSQIDWIFGAIGVGGTAGSFGVWNAYNRLAVSTMVRDSTNSWTYSTAAWRAANNSLTMRVSMIRGLNETPVQAQYMSLMSASSGGNNQVIGIGVDSTTAFSGITGFVNQTNAASGIAAYADLPGLGWHYLSAIEYCASGTGTHNGDAGVPYAQFGLIVSLEA
jgi:hypothetical protein